jgi:DNA-binding beta-propeller fold protein YncE
MFNRNMSRESLGELSLITDFSNESTSYYWGYDLQLSKFAKIDNPFDSECEDSECNEYLTNILALPRDMVMDYDDRYLYVASYANNRVVAFIRDSATGLLIYKTSVQGTPNYLDLEDIDADIKYPMNMALSGDGG